MQDTYLLGRSIHGPGNGVVTVGALVVHHHGRGNDGLGLAAFGDHFNPFRGQQPHDHLARLQRLAQERRRGMHAMLPLHVEIGALHLVDHRRVEREHRIELIGPRHAHFQHRRSLLHRIRVKIV